MCHDLFCGEQGKAVECIMILCRERREGCRVYHDPLYEKEGKAVECIMILFMRKKGRL